MTTEQLLATIGDAPTWVLILHTFFGTGPGVHVNTTVLQPYASQERCDEASRHYEAATMLTVHELRDGGDQDLVLRLVAICMPGPSVGRPLVPR